MKTGWIVEKIGEHVGIAYAPTCGMFDWVPFDDERLVLFPSEDAACAFMLAFKIVDAFVIEHGWYENEI